MHMYIYRPTTEKKPGTTDVTDSVPAHLADLWRDNQPTGVFHAVCMIHKVNYAIYNQSGTYKQERRRKLLEVKPQIPK